MPAKRKTPTHKPHSHDLDKTSIPAATYQGTASSAPYIKSVKEGSLDGFSVETVEPPVAAVSGESEDLLLKPHLRVGGVSGEPADKQVLIRLTESDRLRWGRAAGLEGVSVSEFVRGLVNGRVGELLECSHPSGFVRVYNWPGRPVYSICSKCGARW